MVLFALGDLDGPLCEEVKIGVCRRRSFKSQCDAMSASRSRRLARRAEILIRGECVALRLKTAVFERLHELGCGIEGPWFHAAPIVDGVARECAALNHAALLTEAKADEVERRELEKIMDGSI